MTGFSPRNLKYMRKFAESLSKPAIAQEVLALMSLNISGMKKVLK